MVVTVVRMLKPFVNDNLNKCIELYISDGDYIKRIKHKTYYQSYFVTIMYSKMLELKYGSK